MAERCEYTWNPGTWPYAKRCDRQATTTITVDGVLVELCDGHAEMGADTDDGTGGCSTCIEDLPQGECPQSKRACGHHSNESWTQDQCFWCGKEWGT